MPFKSEAQRRWGAANLSPEKFKEWNDVTPAKLPERVKAKKAAKAPRASVNILGERHK